MAVWARFHRSPGLRSDGSCFVEEIAETDEAERDEHEDHPGRRVVCHPGNDVVAGCRHVRDGAAEHEHGDDPAQTVGRKVVEPRHRKPEPHAECRRRYGHHRARQEAERDAVHGVVQDHELPPYDLFQLVVEGQSNAGRNRRRHQSPAQDGEEIADQQTKQEVGGADARRDEQRSDHQFRAGRVLGGVLTDEALEAQLRRRRHGLSFVFDGLTHR